MKIEIDIPEGYEVDTENSTKECIKLKKIENKLPKTWEEFCNTHPIKVGERYILFNSSIVDGIPHTFRHPGFDRNNLPSKELAEAMLALCQLIQLRDCYNDGWTPNWTNDKYKYIIFPYKNLLHKCYTFTNNRILAFRTAELRDQFFENFKNLIEIAKPLL